MEMNRRLPVIDGAGHVMYAYQDNKSPEAVMVVLVVVVVLTMLTLTVVD